LHTRSSFNISFGRSPYTAEDDAKIIFLTPASRQKSITFIVDATFESKTFAGFLTESVTLAIAASWNTTSKSFKSFNVSLIWEISPRTICNMGLCKLSPKLFKLPPEKLSKMNVSNPLLSNSSTI
jgi:hypothetical protein